jgi:hypothetical protein
MTKFIDHMRVAIVGRVPRLLEFANVTFSSRGNATSVSLTNDNQYRATCELFFEHVGPVGAEDLVRQRAVAAFTHHLYGDIRNELYELRTDIYKMQGSDAALARVNKMIARLS